HPVVAAGRVRAESDHRTAASHPADRRDPSLELRVAARAVRDSRTASTDEIGLAVSEIGAVGHEDRRGEEAQLVEVRGAARVAARPYCRNLGFFLRAVVEYPRAASLRVRRDATLAIEPEHLTGVRHYPCKASNCRRAPH